MSSIASPDVSPADIPVDPRSPLSGPPVVTLHGARYWYKWYGTVRLCRKMRRVHPHPTAALRTRMAALAPVRKPVFILGCPRSGTTFLGEVLEHLPSASYFFEPPLLKYYTRLIYQHQISLAHARRVYRACFRTLLLGAPGNGRRVIEKNPNHTWIAGTLRAIFPDARFIILTRDGRDTALSLMNKPWHLQESQGSGRREPGGYLEGPHPHFYIEPERAAEFAATSNLHRCIWIWRRHTEQIEKLRESLPDDCQFHLRYETLIRQPEETVSRMLDFLGETDPESQHRVAEAARQARDTSIGRWQKRMSLNDLEVV